MYEYIVGTLAEAAPAYAVVETGGIGYFINILFACTRCLYSWSLFNTAPCVRNFFISLYNKNNLLRNIKERK